MFSGQRESLGDGKLREDLNSWHFCVKGEDIPVALSRFLTAFEELRVRLAPLKYPNLEISDEGYLWFNIDASIGTVEVLAFPFGFEELKEPFIAVSTPSKAEDIKPNALERLLKTSNEVTEALLFANKSGLSVLEILSAYKRDQHPALAFTSDFEEILSLKNKGAFFSYLGVRFRVSGKTVSEVEHMIRNIVSRLEGK